MVLLKIHHFRTPNPFGYRKTRSGGGKTRSMVPKSSSVMLYCQFMHAGWWYVIFNIFELVYRYPNGFGIWEITIFDPKMVPKRCIFLVDVYYDNESTAPKLPMEFLSPWFPLTSCWAACPACYRVFSTRKLGRKKPLKSHLVCASKIRFNDDSDVQNPSICWSIRL